MVSSKIPSSPLDNRESIINQAAAMGLQLSDDGQNWVHITEDQQSTDNDERSGMGFFFFYFLHIGYIDFDISDYFVNCAQPPWASRDIPSDAFVGKHEECSLVG